MVDVMLVLLIIFMVITPMLTKGAAVELVKTNHPIAMKDADKEDALVVAVAHREYRALSAEQLRALVRGEKPVIADVKSLFDREALAAAGATVFRL